MRPKKLMLTNLPYVLIGLACTNLGEAWRMAEGGNASEKLLSLIGTIPAAFGNPLPSFNAFDLCVGLVCGLLLRFAVYMKGKNAKKYRHNIEYGAARTRRSTGTTSSTARPASAPPRTSGHTSTRSSRTTSFSRRLSALRWIRGRKMQRPREIKTSSSSAAPARARRGFLSNPI